MSSASVKLVRQKGNWDCAPASLNCIAPRLRYADILRTVRAKLDRPQDGMSNREVIALAADFEIWLSPTRIGHSKKYGVGQMSQRLLDTATGILRIYWNKGGSRAKANPGGHAVAIHGGVILDPGTGDEMPWRAYQTRHGARLGTLLERV
jgi:hypothetical protein